MSPNEPDILFIMDYSHVIKQVCINVAKSGIGQSFVRTLRFNQTIIWEHWVNAFKWDRDTNAFPLHHKLTHDHFFLSQESKIGKQSDQRCPECRNAPSDGELSKISRR